MNHRKLADELYMIERDPNIDGATCNELYIIHDLFRQIYDQYINLHYSEKCSEEKTFYRWNEIVQESIVSGHLITRASSLYTSLLVKYLNKSVPNILNIAEARANMIGVSHKDVVKAIEKIKKRKSLRTMLEGPQDNINSPC